MAMQSDVKATAALTSTGAFKDQATNSIGRCRIKGIYFTSGASAGSVVFSNGTGGATLFTLNTPASTSLAASYLLLPGEGLLVENSLYGTVTNTASVVVFYG